VEGVLAWTVLPLAPKTFVTQLPSGGEIELDYRDQIGLATLLDGAFEASEVAELCRLSRPGTTVVDAGANVGVFTIPLARSVGEQGRVLAFEPTEDTAVRLRANVRRNLLTNVEISQSALGAERRRMTLNVQPDGAFNSLEAGSSGSGPIVEVERLDDVWEGAGRPAVSVVKIDVEGFELEVLEGAQALLRDSQPAILVEAAETQRERAVTEWLIRRGYQRVNADAFQSWNLLFIPAEPPRTSP
jgi:FkbM family methyltransferase